MNKDIIEFPYETQRQYIREDKPLEEFKIHYYYYENYLEKDVYRCYSNKRANGNFIGYIFSVERLHSKNIELDNESNQKYLEAYMDATREIFFNSEHSVICQYFDDLRLDEKKDKIRIDEILKYKAFLKSNKGNFIGEAEFEQFKQMRDFPLVIFIEDVRDTEKNNVNSEHMNLILMLERHFFPIHCTDEFYIYQKYLDFKSKENDEDSSYESDYFIGSENDGLKSLVVHSISEDIDEHDLELMVEVLPEFYYQSYNTEYIKFSVLYQYIEIFIGFIAHKLLEKTMAEKNDKNLVALKSDINTILTEKYRIHKLFSTYSSVLNSDIDKQKFHQIYIDILKEIGLLDDKGDEEDTTLEIQQNTNPTHDELYKLRNILYHNLRAFKNKEVVDQNLRLLNIEFEKIIAKILTTFTC